MRLRTRLVLLVALAALAPLGLLGLGASQVSTRLVSREVARLQATSAGGLAVFVETWMGLELRLVELQAASFDVGALSDRARAAWLRLVLHQTPAAGIVTLTGPGGVDAAPGVRRGEGGLEGLVGREAISEARYRRFRASLPLARARAEGRALGTPYVPEGHEAPVLPVAVAVGDDHVLGVELSLAALAARFALQAGDGSQAVLLDAAGAPVIDTGGDLVDPTTLEPLLGGVRAEDVRYRAPSGVPVVAAVAPVQGLDWTVVLAEPLAQSRAGIAEIRARTLYIAAVAAVLALVLGSVFARQIALPVVELRDAALAVAEGHLGRRVRVRGGGELAQLARAFNLMSTRLARNAEEIARQQAEIEAFNRELQARVDARTRELREAQERLVETARLAAVGELGAGLAHELNNPVAAILGLSQVALAADPPPSEAARLRDIEAQARRCREILARLTELVQDEPAPDRLDRGGPSVVESGVDLDRVVREALSEVASALARRGVVVEHRVAGGMVVRGGRAGLVRGLAGVLRTLGAAARRGGRLRLEARRGGGGVELRLVLAGEDIAVGGDDWMASGMALWDARRLLARAGARLVEPEPGARPATWRILFAGA